MLLLGLGSRRLGFVRRRCLHQQHYFHFHVITGSELDAYPRHPKSDHVMRIKKLLEVTRSMMTGLDSKRIHRKMRVIRGQDLTFKLPCPLTFLPYTGILQDGLDRLSLTELSLVRRCIFFLLCTGYHRRGLSPSREIDDLARASPRGPVIRDTKTAEWSSKQAGGGRVD